MKIGGKNIINQKRLKNYKFFQNFASFLHKLETQPIHHYLHCIKYFTIFQYCKKTKSFAPAVSNSIYRIRGWHNAQAHQKPRSYFFFENLDKIAECQLYFEKYFHFSSLLQLKRSSSNAVCSLNAELFNVVHKYISTCHIRYSNVKEM